MIETIKSITEVFGASNCSDDILWYGLFNPCNHLMLEPRCSLLFHPPKKWKPKPWSSSLTPLGFLNKPKLGLRDEKEKCSGPTAAHESLWKDCYIKCWALLKLWYLWWSWGQPAAGLFAGDTYVGWMRYIVEGIWSMPKSTLNIKWIAGCCHRLMRSTLPFRDGYTVEDRQRKQLISFGGIRLRMTSPK